MRIKSSKRGLTFSFAENETFRAGVKYRYFIDAHAKEVIIVPDKTGPYQFSQKGIHHKPLVDIRNKEIRELIAEANYMEIELTGDKIIVHVITLSSQVETDNDRELVSMLDKEDKVSFELPKEELLHHSDLLTDMLQAFGFFSAKQQKDLQYVFDTASLFSGAGLLDLPFARDDSFDLKFACDFDKATVQTYEKNIGSHILCMDMRDLQPEQVPDIDLIIGGPCCQGYSNANRRNIEKEAAKEKRLLIDDYIRIVQAKRPLVFVIENVPQFLTKEQGKYLEKVITGLSEYEISYQVVCDWELGGYTMRKRMILVGSRIGKITIPDVNLTTKHTAGDALRKVTPDWYGFEEYSKAKPETIEKMKQVRPGHNYKDIREMAHLDRHSDTYYRLSMEKPAITLVNWRKVNTMPPVGNRILSIAEAASLTGLNGKFQFFGTLNDKQQQLGNAVTQAIASFVKSIVKNALYCFANNRLQISL